MAVAVFDDKEVTTWIPYSWIRRKPTKPTKPTKRQQHDDEVGQAKKLQKGRLLEDGTRVCTQISTRDTKKGRKWHVAIRVGACQRYSCTQPR